MGTTLFPGRGGGGRLSPLSSRKQVGWPVDQAFLFSVVLGFIDNLAFKPIVLGMEFSGTVLETGADVSTVKEVNELKSRELMCVEP